MRRSRPPVTERYGQGCRETLEIYPAARRNAPVLMFIHGGFWRSLSVQDFSFVAEPFIDAGACVVLPEYDLCPDVRLGDIVDQIFRVQAWLWERVAEFGGDPSRILVCGHSAGAHLAMLLAQRNDSQQGQPCAVLGLSGLYDLEPLSRTTTLQSVLRLTEDDVASLSPSRLPPPEQGSIHLAFGNRESPAFIRQTHALAQAWGCAVVQSVTELETDHLRIVDELSNKRSAIGQKARQLLGM